MKIVTVEEMRQIEKQADSSGLSYSRMMENAGRGLANIIRDHFPEINSNRLVLALVGPGNNGGDALVALAWLAKWGYHVCAYLIKTRENDDLVSQVTNAGGEIVERQQDTSFSQLEYLTKKADLILDGLLGTGAKLPLRSEYTQLLKHVRSYLDTSNQKPYVVAVDCPSGVDCDSGAIAENVLPANLTGTMAAVKQGLTNFPAANYAGHLSVIEIGNLEGLPAWESIRRFIVDSDWIRNILPDRPTNAHKGTFGTVLVCAGSINFTGAAWLAGQAAYRIGSGLVTLALPEPLYYTLAGQFPESTWLILPDEMGVINETAASVLKENLGNATALLLGPGWGQEDCTREFLHNLLTPGSTSHSSQWGFAIDATTSAKTARLTLPPLIIDADGLKLLVKIEGWQKLLPAETIFTPHPGEMSLLTGLNKNEINTDRIGIAEKYSRLWGQVIVLKGANTVIAEPEGRVALIPVATSALARAGTGDVLAGLIAGLRAQGVGAFPSAVTGAWIHAQAGLLAAQTYGTTVSIMAGDLLQQIPKVIAGILG